MSHIEDEDVRALIRSCIPNTDALEVFILVATTPRTWHLAELAAALGDMVSPKPDLAALIETFVACGLVSGDVRAGFQFAPRSAETAAVAVKLVLAYNERPVTLIRTVYSIADAQKIQAFANAFRLRKDT